MLKAALDQLARGRVVAIATESFFGLLADVTSTSAVDELLSLKPRGSDKGVPLLLPDRASWLTVTDSVPELADRLASRFWPGPLTIALPRKPELDVRLSLDESVAVRVPGESPAYELVRAFGRPLTATSANLPGQPPATRDAEVAASFGEAIGDGRLLVVRGTAPGGRPSTVVVVGTEGLRIAREGAISSAAVLAAAGP
jgi:L-threonylcarbamoyladenylate synthase